MATINSILRGLFDSLMGPFQDLSPLVTLIPISVLTAIFALLVYKYTSKQERIAEVKDQMFAGIFEIRLFNDDLSLILKATGTILNYATRYLALSVWPAMVILMIPLVFVIAQLQFQYGFQGFEPGDTVLLEVELVAPEGAESFETGAAKPPTDLQLPGSVVQETPAVWIPSQNQLAWRLRVDDWGDYELGITVDGETVTKSLVASESIVRRSPVRTDTGFWNQLLYPAEKPLPSDSVVASISIDYRDGTIPFLWIDWNWLILYVVLMIVIGFALAKPMDVTV